MLLVDTLNNGPLVVVDLSKPSISIVGPILVVRDPLIDVKEGVLPLLHRVKGSGIETSDVKIVLRNSNSIRRNEHISADINATGIEEGNVFHERTRIIKPFQALLPHELSICRARLAKGRFSPLYKSMAPHTTDAQLIIMRF